MFYIYQFYNDKNQLLYIGKTINLVQRFISHFSENNWKSKEVSRIMYAECKTKTDMDIYEIYYINVLNPRYNISLVNNVVPSFKLEELDFKEYRNELNTSSLNKSYSNIFKSNKPNTDLLITEQRFLFMSLEIILKENIKYNNKNLNFYYQVKIPIVDYIKKFNIKANNIYDIIRNLLDSFSMKHYKINNDYKVLVEYCTVDDNNDIVLFFNMETIKYLIKNKDKYLFFNVNIRNKYTLKLFNISKELNNKRINYEDLRGVLLIGEKYNMYSDFKRQLLDPAIKEINNLSNINIVIIPKFTYKTRQIETVQFKLN